MRNLTRSSGQKELIGHWRAMLVDTKVAVGFQLSLVAGHSQTRFEDGRGSSVVVPRFIFGNGINLVSGYHCPHASEPLPRPSDDAHQHAGARRAAVVRDLRSMPPRGCDECGRLRQCYAGSGLRPAHGLQPLRDHRRVRPTESEGTAKPEGQTGRHWR